MMGIEVFGESASMASLAEVLEGFYGVSRVRQVDATRPGHALVSVVGRRASSRLTRSAVRSNEARSRTNRSRKAPNDISRGISR